MKHDTWTHAQAALLLCGLDPDRNEISEEGELEHSPALMLDGSEVARPASVPYFDLMADAITDCIRESVPLRQVFILDTFKKTLAERVQEHDAHIVDWAKIFRQVHDCLHWLQASPLAERAFPQHYLAWAKRKGLAEYIFTALGDNLASVLGEVDEQPRSFPEPPVQPAPPAMDPAPRADRPSPEDYLLRLAALFDPVKVSQLETMFPANDQWVKYAERAQRNGLVIARTGRRVFNPMLAADWWVHKQGASPGWDWDRCLKRLERNLPARSEDQRGQFPKYD